MQNDHEQSNQRHLESMYRANRLKVVISHAGLKGIFSRSARVACTNFNHHGLVFSSERKFVLGQRVIVDLCIGSVLARELVALIATVVREGNEWHHTADFCFDHTHMLSPAIGNTLRNVEQKLKILASYPLS